MRNNTGNYTQDGVIYFTANPGASFSLTTTSLGNGDFNTLNDYNLTLQGGWNGLNGASATFTGTTNFGSNTLTRWHVRQSLGWEYLPGQFYVQQRNQRQCHHHLHHQRRCFAEQCDGNPAGRRRLHRVYRLQSGDITVQNSTFDGNNSGSNRDRGFPRGHQHRLHCHFQYNIQGCPRLYVLHLLLPSGCRENANGATLSAPTVTLNNVTAFNNDLSGIEINNANSVWMNNVVSYDNGTFILIVGFGSGVNVNGAGSTVVHVNGGTLSNNEAYGLSVFSGSISATSDPTCSGNRYPGPHLSPVLQHRTARHHSTRSQPARRHDPRSDGSFRRGCQLLSDRQ
ncbi:MAG: hypothetical protein M0C28_29020 [Candidatus Moduliflexus flocculans]|nr:hypothetical protein [Candidatus Moduliflexus flocculans]